MSLSEFRSLVGLLFIISQLNIIYCYPSSISSSVSIKNVTCEAESLVMKCSINGYSQGVEANIKVVYTNDINDQRTNPYYIEDYIYIPETEGEFIVYQEFYRFQPLTIYIFRFLDSKTDNELFEYEIKSGSTGYNALDSNPMAKISGNPTFDLIGFDYGGDYIAIDHTGWIVWALNLHSKVPLQRAQCKSQYIDNGKSTCDRSSEDCNYRYAAIVNGTTGYYYPNGTVIKYLANYNCSPWDENKGGYYNHELRASLNDIGSAYGIRMLLKNVSGFKDPQLGQIITKWDIEKNSLTYITNSFNLVNVESTKNYPFSNSANNVNCTDISNKDGIKGRDYSHLNSASDSQTVGQEGIVISSRQLSIIFLVDHNTGAIKWQISSIFESDFTFVNDDDKFYNQHDPQLLENGRLLLINNDVTDPNSVKRTSAYEYQLDFEKMTIELIWKFSPDFNRFTSEHGGGISALPNGNRLVCFTSTGNSGMQQGVDSLCYEIDPNGNQVAQAPLLTLEPNTSSTYRGEAWDTINGEKIYLRNI